MTTSLLSIHLTVLSG